MSGLWEDASSKTSMPSLISRVGDNDDSDGETNAYEEGNDSTSQGSDDWQDLGSEDVYQGSIERRTGNSSSLKHEDYIHIHYMLPDTAVLQVVQGSAPLQEHLLPYSDANFLDAPLSLPPPPPPPLLYTLRCNSLSLFASILLLFLRHFLMNQSVYLSTFLSFSLSLFLLLSFSISLSFYLPPSSSHCIYLSIFVSLSLSLSRSALLSNSLIIFLALPMQHKSPISLSHFCSNSHHLPHTLHLILYFSGQCAIPCSSGVLYIGGLCESGSSTSEILHLNLFGMYTPADFHDKERLSLISRNQHVPPVSSSASSYVDGAGHISDIGISNANAMAPLLSDAVQKWSALSAGSFGHLSADDDNSIAHKSLVEKRNNIRNLDVMSECRSYQIIEYV